MRLSDAIFICCKNCAPSALLTVFYCVAGQGLYLNQSDVYNLRRSLTIPPSRIRRRALSIEPSDPESGITEEADGSDWMEHHGNAAAEHEDPYGGVDEEAGPSVPLDTDDEGSNRMEQLQTVLAAVASVLGKVPVESTFQYRLNELRNWVDGVREVDLPTPNSEGEQSDEEESDEPTPAKIIKISSPR